jgi:2-polyprenyl-3-methyl-5-hydroxy-6-metoxy-1,4-benzoquinol methylase
LISYPLRNKSINAFEFTSLARRYNFTEFFYNVVNIFKKGKITVSKLFNPYANYTSTAVLVGQDEAAVTRWSAGRFAASIAPHLPQNRSVHIIEIGCGYGRNIKALQELGYSNIRGVDISEEQIAYASNQLKLINVGVSDAVSALVGEEEVYDVILLLDVLEHLELSYSVQLIELVKRALKPGGVFIIQVPNAMSPLSPHRHWDITHLRAYTTHSMEQHLRLGGFTQMKHFELPPHIHGFFSFIRRGLWIIALKPLITAYMLIANGSTMGSTYTTNMLTVVQKN